MKAALPGVERIPLLRRIERSQQQQQQQQQRQPLTDSTSNTTDTVGPQRDWDCRFADLTRRRGYDTLFILRSAWLSSEIVVAATGCMNQSEPLRSGCVPADVGLRAGWGGALPCRCVDDAPGLGTIVNCAG